MNKQLSIYSAGGGTSATTELLTTSVLISNAEVLALATTPKLLVAGVANKIIVPLNTSLFVTYGTPTDNSARNLIVGVSNSPTTSDYYCDVTFFMFITTDSAYYSMSNKDGGSVTNLAPPTKIGVPLQLWTSATPNGGYSMRVVTTYRLIDKD